MNVLKLEILMLFDLFQIDQTDHSSNFNTEGLKQLMESINVKLDIVIDQNANIDKKMDHVGGRCLRLRSN